MADILAAQSGAPGPVYEGGPDANVTLGGVLSALGLGGPSWLDAAGKQTGADIAAYQRGGVPEMMADTSGTQDLAGGFGGTTTGKGIRAYHGSPYDFEKFDISKIGTGEGAQAYGHGLYFAENEKVAKEYRDALSRQMLPRNQQTDLAQSMFTEARGNTDEAIKRLQKEIGYYDQKGWPSPDYRNQYDQAITNLKAGNVQTPGKMYEVNINAEPGQFLDYEKPISQQGASVRSAYENIYGKPDPRLAELRVRETDELMNALAGDRDPVTNQMRNEPEWFKLARNRDKAWAEWNRAQSGRQVYEDLARKLGNEALGSSRLSPKMASAALAEQGIPGIRYLDQGSRGAQQGTSNYVVFNPEIVDILKKYGLAGLTMGGVLQAQTEPPPP